MRIKIYIIIIKRAQPTHQVFAYSVLPNPLLVLREGKSKMEREGRKG